MWIFEPFFQQAGRSPDAPAVVYKGRSTTYRELADNTARLSALLAGKLDKGTIVAFEMEKSDRAITLMIACLMAGLAYVPLDSRSPSERCRFIALDSGSGIVVVDARSAPRWADAGLAVWHADDLFEAALAETSAPGRVREPASDDLAYMLYTSGSTGKPKGVMITHGNAETFVRWAMSYFPMKSVDRIGIVSPLHFDLCVLDIYAGLGCGATLYPLDDVTTFMPEALYRFLRDNRITLTYTVPTAYISMLRRSTLAAGGLPDLKYLLYAGEPFQPDLLALLLKSLPHARAFNLYGPIETNIITVREVQPGDLSGRDIPLGTAVAEASIRLVDDRGAVITEPSVQGELIVAGPSVSPGYRNAPERASQFNVVLPGEPGVRYYRTGDYAWLDERNLLRYVGRMDFIVKTRGFRVELGEVEAALMRHPQIAEAAVIAQPHEEFANVLVAHVAFRPGVQPQDPSKLNEFCQKQLPSYMLPVKYVIHDSLPKTGTGKISRVPLKEQPTAPV